MMIETVLISVIILILGLWFVYDRKQKKTVMDALNRQFFAAWRMAVA